MADIFDEVNEDLRAERAQRFVRQYGVWLLLLAVLVVAGVGGWQAWRWNQVRQSEAVAGSFLTAMRATAGTAPSPDARAGALDSYTKIAGTAPEGYRSLALLRAAALRAEAGDGPGASALWDQLARDQAADPLLRDLATLTWAQHQVDAGDPAAVQARLQPLLAAGNPWRPLALEVQAWVLIRTGQDGPARDTLRGLAADTAAPDGVRGRANGLLSRLGGAVE